MASSDIRDIMDLGHDGPRQPAPKKTKKRLIDQQARMAGISREVQALMGDSVPPVAIVENPKYKSKPSIAMKMFKARHWEDRSFTHAARNDGLVLRHWKRSIPGTGLSTSAVQSPDAEMADADAMPTNSEMQFEEDYPSEKWNVQVNVVTYTDEQYHKYCSSEDWTKEETDYLLDLCRDYDLRWIIIADRYNAADVESKASNQDGDALHPMKTYPDRTMESLKARYYTISAKMLEAHTPASQMTNSEFQLWEKMRNFDAKAEAVRKEMAQKLFERTKDEAEEEKVLLEELHRITKNEDDFIRLRKDLYSRLETAPSLRRNERGEDQSAAAYQSSHGLGMLLQSLLNRERKLKRSMPNGPDSASTTAPTPTDSKRHSMTYNRRETMDSQADESGPSKKGSVYQPVVKILSPAEQVKYGISHPQERLTSGVMFRHEKINRITTAKSQVQTQKIQSALTELGIPPRLLMPTERVCREFERLVSEVQLLLEARRGLEKVTSEVKVLEEHKRIRLGHPKEDQTNTNGAKMSVPQTPSNTGEPEKDKPVSGAAYPTKQEPDANGDTNMLSDIQNADNDDDEVGQSVAEEDEDEDIDADAEVDQSVLNAAEDDVAAEDDEDIRLDDEDEDDEDDEPGPENLKQAHQHSDEEDEDEEDDGAEELEMDDGDNASDDNDARENIEDAEIDDSVVNEDDADNENDGEEEEEDDEEGADDDGNDEGETHVNADVDNEALDYEGDEISRPSSSRGSHKRSASILSEASKAGSTRSGPARKKRR